MNILEYMYVYIYIHIYLHIYIHTYIWEGDAGDSTIKNSIFLQKLQYISLQFGECIHLGFATLFTFPHGHPHDWVYGVGIDLSSHQFQAVKNHHGMEIGHELAMIIHESAIGQ